MAKKRASFLLWQKVTAGVIAVVAIGILGAMYTMVVTEAPLGQFVEGEHYQLIEEPRRVRGDKVEVMEFFSYACVHCFNFDAPLNAWVEDNAETVNFIRTPAIGSNYWRILGRSYYTMAELGILEENHDRLFREIHEVRRPMDSVDDFAGFVDGSGTSAVAFRSMFNSAVINRRVEFADEMARRLRVASVPTIVVNGKYLVRITNEVGPTRMLEVMDHLIEKEMAAEQPTAMSGE